MRESKDMTNEAVKKELRYEKAEELTAKTTLAEIKREDETVWVMGHVFLSPKASQADLDQLMNDAKQFAASSGHKIWVLDPKGISYFMQHPDFEQVWADKPSILR